MKRKHFTDNQIRQFFWEYVTTNMQTLNIFQFSDFGLYIDDDQEVISSQNWNLVYL